MPIDEAVAFWREAYGDTMTNDKFNKEYKYNIRHSYGLEGKRSNYPARRCVRLSILTNLYHTNEVLLYHAYSPSRTLSLPLAHLGSHSPYLASPCLALDILPAR